MSLAPCRYLIQLLLPRETGGDKTKQFSVLSALMSCIKHSQQDEERGQMRKKWLQELRAVYTSTNCMTDPSSVFVKAFSVLHEDNRMYGVEGAVLSANVTEAVGNGKEIFQLRFIAATSQDEHIVGQTISWTDPDAVFFSAVTEGLPIHVISAQKHGHVKNFRTFDITPVA